MLKLCPPPSGIHKRAVFCLLIAQLLCLMGHAQAAKEENGFLQVEAESFSRQSQDQVRRWYAVRSNEFSALADPDQPHIATASGGQYLEILPDTRTTHDDPLIVGESFSNEPGKLAVLHYPIEITTPGRYYIWVRAYSTGTEDNGVHVGMDGIWPSSGQRMQWCEGKNSWHWASQQRTQEVHCGLPGMIYLDIETPGPHEIQFSMREDGFEMDQWLMTTDKHFQPDNGPAGDHGRFKGEFTNWHTLSLNFDGPMTSETDAYNPFFNYRLNVRFTHPGTGKSYLVPGHYAADGFAGQTGATDGNTWRVHFTPDETGEWTYEVDFRKGKWVAVSDKPNAGVSGGYMDSLKGSFKIEASNKEGRDFRAKGRLQYVGERYLKFAESGEYFLKQGPDAPENFLAYVDFDGTFQNDGHKDNLVKNWEAHQQDFREGDPTCQNGKGKAIIGALNYLAEKGLNSVSFLTNNIAGDDQNVFPYIDYDTFDRIDVSKMDQWDIVFSHAQALGLFLHFKMLEVENQGLLDNGGVGAMTKLYFRELISRFGHHLALNWNLCEENGEWIPNHPTPPQSTMERLSMTHYMKTHDPYHHHLVIHNGIPYDDLLGPESGLTGPSVQTHRPDFSTIHKEVLHLIRASEKAGHPWAVAVDEPGDAQHSLLPDDENPDHDIARRNGLWGTLMAGGWGNEWYFGYKHAHSDLTCQDYRSRDKFWDQAVHAMHFFKDNEIPFWEMDNQNALVGNEQNDNTHYCLAKTGEVYVVYLNASTTTSLDLSNTSGSFDVRWFNPKSGGSLQKSDVRKVRGGSVTELGLPPDSMQQDWAILIRKK